jgi:hypothetical protein
LGLGFGVLGFGFWVLGFWFLVLCFSDDVCRLWAACAERTSACFQVWGWGFRVCGFQKFVVDLTFAGTQITRHTSHVTPSHVTRHTSHVTGLKLCVAPGNGVGEGFPLFPEVTKDIPKEVSPTPPTLKT